MSICSPQIRVKYYLMPFNSNNEIVLNLWKDVFFSTGTVSMLFIFLQKYKTKLNIACSKINIFFFVQMKIIKK